jgi:hypothetical protein
VPAW